MHFLWCAFYLLIFFTFFTEMGTEFYRVFCSVFELCCTGFVLEFFSVSECVSVCSLMRCWLIFTEF